LRRRSNSVLVVGLALLAALAACNRFEALQTTRVCSAEAAREAATEDATRAVAPRDDYGSPCGPSRRYVNRVYQETYDSLRPSPASAVAGERDEQ